MRISLFILLVFCASYGYSQSEDRSFNSSLESVRALSPENIAVLEEVLEDFCIDCELVYSSENPKSLDLKMDNPFDLYDFLIEANNRNLFIAHISSNYSQSKLSNQDLLTQKSFTLAEQKKLFKQYRPEEYNDVLKLNNTEK